MTGPTRFRARHIRPLGSQPPAQSMLVADGRVVAFDDDGPTTVDLDGVVVPAFADSHLHLFSLIERAVAVDCSAASSLTALVARLAATPGTPDRWVRATGYDETRWPEARHPTRDDLDRAHPVAPVRLLHRTGHIAVMNSAGLARVPPDVLAAGDEAGFVEREPPDGRPNGRLWEPGQWMSGRVLPPLAPDELERGLAAVIDVLLAHGVTAVHDASVTNDLPRWQWWRRRWASAPPPFRLLFMPGEQRLEPFIGRDRGDEWLRLGPAKFIVPDDPRDLPTAADLRERVRSAQAAGFSVALHAIVHSAVERVVEATRGLPGPIRIEHAAEWPPTLFAVADPSRLHVTLHPSWVRERADRYLAQIAPETRLWTHRAQSFVARGVTVRFGSDAPVSAIDPLGALATAVTRRAATGTVFLAHEAVASSVAWAAMIRGRGDVTGGDGALAPGAAADFVLLDRDPFALAPDEWPTLRVLATFLGGVRVWPAP